jgi:hypothetical protein
MDYPEDFPEHLKPQVDAVIHAAEIAFIDGKEAIPESRFQYEAERLILQYIETVFFGFATQAVQAGREGVWNGERIRGALPEFMDDLSHRTYFDKHPDPAAYHASERFKATLKKKSKEWKGWRAIHEGLKQVAELRGALDQTGSATRGALHQGYRKQIQDWMEREGLEKVEHAARRLHLSKSALKSIMSSKGKPRYSRETLKRVLKEIGSEKEGE